MSRSKSKKTLSEEKMRSDMKKIVSPLSESIHSDLLDESPDAYKPIQTVIDRQRGLLVDIVDHYNPVLVVKG